MNKTKPVKRWLRNNATIFFILLIFCCYFFSTGAVKAQSISKYYTSSVENNGTIYYIKPQGGFNGKEKNYLVYDITYVTSKDAAVFNFSYYDRLQLTIDSIAFTTHSGRYVSPASKIFVESKKHKWLYRYAAAFQFSDLRSVFADKNAPSLTIYCQGNPILLNQRQKKWAKHAAITSKIFDLILLNKSR